MCIVSAIETENSAGNSNKNEKLPYLSSSLDRKDVQLLLDTRVLHNFILHSLEQALFVTVIAVKPYEVAFPNGVKLISTRFMQNLLMLLFKCGLQDFICCCLHIFIIYS